MEPLVSVVIPTFKRPEYLKIALGAALAQTHRNIEFIVHDNASPQDIAALVAEFGDARIRFYRNDENLGQTRNFLAGLSKAKGKYFAILADDDIWRPEFVAALVVAMEADPDIVVAFCDHDMVDAAGGFLPAETERAATSFGRQLLRHGAYSPFDDIALVYRAIPIISGSLIRLDSVDWSMLPPDLRLSFDVYIAYLLARTGKKCFYVPRSLMSWRLHGGSATSQVSRTADARGLLDIWNTFRNDPRIRYRDYFTTLCFRKALVILYDKISRRRWPGLKEDLRIFYKMGLLDIRIVYYHVKYIIHFWQKGITRMLP